MDGTAKFFIDAILGTVILRVVLGWLVAFPRLIRLLFIFAGAIVGSIIIYNLRLPLSLLLLILLIIPAFVFIFLSFLPELTRVYQAARRGQLLAGSSFTNPELVPTLAEALFDMASMRRGALVVLAGNDDMDSLCSGGEEIDAKVNRDLLLSIFTTSSPRHDGAVLIARNRISRIGAVLPLASAEKTTANIGTRHLAALGLAERSDAHIFVASEQRGSIMYAHGEEFIHLPTNDVEALEDRIHALLGTNRNDKKQKRARRLSWLLWAVSLFLAAGGAHELAALQKRYDAKSNPTVLAQVNAKITLANPPANGFIENLSSPVTALSVRIPLNIAIDPNLTLVIDCKDLGFGKHTVTLTSDMLRGLSKEAQVEKFEPSQIVLTLVESRLLQVAVSKPTTLNLPEGFRIRETEWSPGEMEVLVRDTKWKASQKLAPLPLDLGFVQAPGTYVLETKLDLPAFIEPVAGAGANKIRTEFLIEKTH